MSEIECSIHPLGPDLLDAAFDLATRVFVEGSSLHSALGVSLEGYQTYLRPSFSNMIDEGLSVVAVDGATNAILGCMVVTDFKKQLRTETITNTQFAPIAALTQELCRLYLKNADVRTGEAILVDMGVVSKVAQGQGLYKRMRRAVHEIAKFKGYSKVVGELSSSATQHFVIDRLQHKVMAEVAFTDFQFDESYPFATIHEPRSIILAQGDL